MDGGLIFAVSFSIVLGIGLIIILILYITSLNTQKSQLSRLEEYTRFRTFFENAMDGIVIVDEEGVVTEWNSGEENITGLSASDAIGQKYWNIHESLSPSEDYTTTVGEKVRDTLLINLEEGKLSGENQPIQYEIKRPDGSRRIVQEMVFPIQTSKGYMMGCITRDMTTLDKVEEALSEFVLRDELTGLYNRRGFDILAEHKLYQARQSDIPTMVFYTDLDNMKWINDTLGHNQGDNALRDMALILIKTFRNMDVVARMGGDEFAVFLIPSAKFTPEVVRKRFYENLEYHNRSANREYNLAASCGVAVNDANNTLDIKDMIQHSDELMLSDKRAKKTQKDRKN
jgi:diguanylate cyclase (GGDEF)-like protein/PAS domain S-box-containing protein